MTQQTPPRVRFAPSPTGPLHMGGVRTALYNWLFARKHGGTFILRIEDTDSTRFVEGAEDYVVEALKWCRLTPDEGIGAENPGPHGPYRQSERTPLYKAAVEVLLAAGWAYRAFDSAEELAAKRSEAEAGGMTFQYDARTRGGMRNDLALGADEVQTLLQTGTPHVIRFKTPETAEDVVFDDAIRGRVSVSSHVLDDKVLLKPDGLPTYHLANVVDDHHMQISHVIRGEEWLPSAALHMLLYRALGWEVPIFAHLPLILKPEGNGKLGKRDGIKGGFPVFPLAWTDPATGDSLNGYRENGYLPEAFLNMLLLLGWNPGDEQELFSMEEAAGRFGLDRVVKSGARFNPDKARWFNEQHLRSKPTDVLVPMLEGALLEAGRPTAQAAELLDLMLDRVSFLNEIPTVNWLFEAPTTFDEKLVKKKWKDETAGHLLAVRDRLAALEPFDASAIEADFKAYLEEAGLGFGAVLLPLRIVLTGVGGGPSMFAFAAYLGKENSLARIDNGLQAIAAQRASH